MYKTVLGELEKRPWWLSAGAFARAAELAQTIEAAVGQPADEQQQLMHDIARLQSHLAGIGDDRAYSIDEAQSYASDPSKWHSPR